MGSACIADKNGQGTFLTAGKQAGHCAFLKMPKGNATYVATIKFLN